MVSDELSGICSFFFQGTLRTFIDLSPEL